MFLLLLFELVVDEDRRSKGTSSDLFHDLIVVHLRLSHVVKLSSSKPSQPMIVLDRVRAGFLLNKRIDTNVIFEARI